MQVSSNDELWSLILGLDEVTRVLLTTVWLLDRVQHGFAASSDTRWYKKSSRSDKDRREIVDNRSRSAWLDSFLALS